VVEVVDSLQGVAPRGPGFRGRPFLSVYEAPSRLPLPGRTRLGRLSRRVPVSVGAERKRFELDAPGGPGSRRQVPAAASADAAQDDALSAGYPDQIASCKPESRIGWPRSPKLRGQFIIRVR